MTTRECTYVLTVARERSITKAADKLFVTQPALSLFLNRLEDELGAPLFNRSKSGLTPTFIGQKYLETAQKMLELENSFRLELCDFNRECSGEIRIGTSPHIGSLILPCVITAFRKLYPNIELKITENHSGALERMLEECVLDIALLHLPMKTKCAEWETIAHDPFLVAFAQGNHAGEAVYSVDGVRYPYLDLSRVMPQKYILSRPEQRVRQISDRILDHAGINPEICLITSSVQTALRFAAEDLGVTFLPESYLQLFNYSPKLSFCYLPDEYEAYWDFCMAYPKGKKRTGPVQKFIEITKDSFGPKKQSMP